MDVSAAERRREARRAWSGLALPPLAWIVFEYGAGMSLRGGCAAIGGWAGPVWGATSVALCIVAAVVARPAAAAAAERNPAARRWLARIAMLGAGVFALAITYQTLATLIVPGCAR